MYIASFDCHNRHIHTTHTHMSKKKNTHTRTQRTPPHTRMHIHTHTHMSERTTFVGGFCRKYSIKYFCDYTLIVTLGLLTIERSGRARSTTRASVSATAATRHYKTRQKYLNFYIILRCNYKAGGASGLRVLASALLFGKYRMVKAGDA